MARRARVDGATVWTEPTGDAERPVGPEPRAPRGLWEAADRPALPLPPPHSPRRRALHPLPHAPPDAVVGRPAICGPCTTGAARLAGPRWRRPACQTVPRLSLPRPALAALSACPRGWLLVVAYGRAAPTVATATTTHVRSGIQHGLVADCPPPMPRQPPLARALFSAPPSRFWGTAVIRRWRGSARCQL